MKKTQTWPVVVKQGFASVKVYKLTQADGTPLYSVNWRLDGKRHRRAFADFARAKIEAANICRKLAAGEAQALQLTGYDAGAYVRALESLKPFGISLDTAIAHFTEAVNVLGSDMVVDAAKDFARRHPANMPRKTVSEVVVEMIEAKRKAQRSLRYVQDLASRAGAFAEAFQCPILSVTGADLRSYLDGKKIAPRTYKNHAAAVSTLFQFAKARGYLPKDFDVLEGIEIPEDRNNKGIEIYLPDEITALLAHADARVVPAIAIAAFAGVRTAEIERLDWSEVRLADGFIEIKARKAKTASRRLVPISDNLRQWLAPHAGKIGPVVYDGAGEYFFKLLKKASDGAGITWKRNAMRHSYISYRVALVQDVGKVALEAGNSPQMIFQHYRELVRPADAERWFSIVPDGASNVVPLVAVA